MKQRKSGSQAKKSAVPDPGRVQPPPPPARGFLPWLRRSLPAILILLITGGIFLWLLLRANQGRIFYSGNREEYVYQDETGTVAYTVERAKVVNISLDTVQVDRDNPDGKEKGNQRLLVRLLSGTHQGEVLELAHDHMVGLYTSERAREGDEITVLQRENLDTGELALEMKNYNRTGSVYLLLGLFVLVVLLVGGKTGFKSLVGLGITVIALIWIFCPMWMKGWEPIPLAFWLCVLVAVMSFVILGGTDRKILCAILGTLAGVGLAALFSELAQKLCRVDSYALYDAGADFADLANLQLRDYPVRLQGILTAGIIIASLGAVMDVAMSLSSAISELKTVNPDLGVRELWRSGMRIGRDMVGTMTNTLVLAFVGSSLVLVLRLWIQGASYNSLLSSRYLSVELISALSSSIGVILAVPLTALIGALLYGAAKPRPNP